MGTLTGSVSFSTSATQHSDRRTATVPVIATLVMLIGSSVFLFARLGHYSLWTDEAVTAVTAAGVWQTGDTSAWLNDHNLLTYRNGLLLKDQKDRYTSPLQFYVDAPFIGLLGHSAFAARLPFALCGFGTVLLMLRWLRESDPPDLVWLAATIILLTSCEFFLFQGQCRYFALTTFLATLIAYRYCHWDGTRKHLLLTGIAMSLLLASQYLDYAAFVGCLLVDYGIWGRRGRTIRGGNWLILALPQLIVAAIVCPIWNPIARAASVVQTSSPAIAHAVASPTSLDLLRGFIRLFWWNIRDLTACEFVILPLLVICPLLYAWNRNTWLMRAPTALIVFVGGIVLFTVHPVPPVGNAEVRYLAPVLPLCIGISIIAVGGMRHLPGWARTALLLLAGIGIAESSAPAYYHELWQPAAEPYAPVACWINQNIPPRGTVYVCPDWCVAPLMWNAPEATYVWQLSDPPPAPAEYAKLPSTFFGGRVPPDYLIAFGPDLAQVNLCRSQLLRQGVSYDPIATIPTYYKEVFRPELIWRSFATLIPQIGQEVIIFKRTTRFSAK